MEKYLNFTRHKFSVFKPILFLLVLILWPACAEKKMTLNEAKQVTVYMSDKSFVPPPRRINDILSILDQPGQFDTETITIHRGRASASLPVTENAEELAKFYFQKGRSALELGRSKLSLEDLRKSLYYAEMLNEKKVANLIPFLSPWIARSYSSAF